MFDKIKNFALEKAYQMARKRGCDCPQCGKQMELPRAMPEGGLDAVFTCHHCQWVGGMTEMWSDDTGEQRVARKPDDSKVKESMSADGQTWLLPAKGGINFFWLFALFWLGIVGFISVGALFGEPVQSDSGDTIEGPFLVLFLLPFWLVGIGMLYVAIRTTFGYYTIIKNHRELVVRRHLFGRVTDKALDLNQIKRVRLHVGYSQNKRPVYEVMVEAKEGKSLKFGSMLTKEEKSWMVSELVKACKLKAPSSAKHVTKSRHSAKVEDVELDELKSKSLVLERMSGSGFRIIRNYVAGKWMLLVAIVFLIVGGVFLTDGVTTLSANSGGQENGFFELIPRLFSAGSLIGGTIASLVGLVIGAIGVSFLGGSEVFEFGDHELIWNKRKRGQSVKKKHYNRSSFTGVKRSNSGAVNNQPRYKVIVTGEKPATVVSFVSADVADELEQWVIHWLQNDELSSYGSAMEV